MQLTSPSNGEGKERFDAPCDEVFADTAALQNVTEIYFSFAIAMLDKRFSSQPSSGLRGTGAVARAL